MPAPVTTRTRAGDASTSSIARGELLHRRPGDGIASFGTVDREHGDEPVAVEPDTGRRCHRAEYIRARRAGPCGASEVGGCSRAANYTIYRWPPRISRPRRVCRSSAATDPTISTPDHLERIGAPGEFPFTRGNHPGGYRDRLWTFRQYSGFGTAEWSNERYKLLLKEGGTGLSVAADLPTQIGYDSDDPDVEEEVGRVGVALDSLADAEILFRDIPLDRISTSWTVNGTAAIMLAFYVAVGDKQGVRA